MNVTTNTRPMGYNPESANPIRTLTLILCFVFLFSA